MLGATDSGFAPGGAVTPQPPAFRPASPPERWAMWRARSSRPVGGLPTAGATGSGFAPGGAVTAAGDFPPPPPPHPPPPPPPGERPQQALPQGFCPRETGQEAVQQRASLYGPAGGLIGGNGLTWPSAGPAG